MKLNKAVITFAGPKQRKLPIQTLIDSDGEEKSILEILVEEVLNSGIDKIGCIINPKDEDTYRATAGNYESKLHFISQDNPRGYGHAIYLAKSFTGNEPFLHLVGDHLYVSKQESRCATRLVKLFEKEKCSISAVHSTRESLMPNYGVIGGKRVKNHNNIFRIDKVIEKPTPTEAEQSLFVPGLRMGHYLCFFGMHILTPAIFKVLESKLREVDEDQSIDLASSLNILAQEEKYLAYNMEDWRYDVGTKYGLLKAQVALAMSGKDRDRVLSELLEFFTAKEL